MKTSLKNSDSESTEIIFMPPKQIQEAQSQNLSASLTSIKKSNWLLSLVTVAVAFAIIPLFPILIAFVAGHWISKQNK